MEEDGTIIPMLEQHRLKFKYDLELLYFFLFIN